MSLGQINLLPVELFHNIFIYLSAHEIFKSFSNLSDYIDNILISYDRYLVNFCSVLKCDFDVTCNSIRPDKVICLILSDDSDTPNQSELFFSIFNIEQFINLRSFDISLINNDTCQKLLNLHKLKYLSSLELPHLFQPYNINFDNTIRKILPQLNRLMVYNTYYLIDNSLPNLHHLTLKHCYRYQLSILSKFLPNLYSLDIIITLDIQTNWLNYIPSLNNLRKLVLNTPGQKLKMIQIKEFLSKMVNIRHFEVDTEGSIDLIDGQQWELIISNFIIFDFRIHLVGSLLTFSEENILQSFRSPFWIEHKRWFVAYDMKHIFTVPRFVSNIAMYPYIYRPPLCTLPNFCFDEYIKCLHVSLINPIHHRFTNITSIVFDTDQIIKDIRLVSFITLIEQMDLLYSISIWDLSIFNYLPNDVAFNKIRNLYVRNINRRQIDEPIFDINRLCIIFPRLQRLNMELTSDNDLLLLIDQLKYLSIAIFQLNYSSYIDRSSFLSSLITRYWLINNCQRFKDNNNFTFKFINNNIHLWINNQKVCALSLIDFWIEGRSDLKVFRSII